MILHFHPVLWLIQLNIILSGILIENEVLNYVSNAYKEQNKFGEEKKIKAQFRFSFDDQRFRFLISGICFSRSPLERETTCRCSQTCCALLTLKARISCAGLSNIVIWKFVACDIPEIARRFLLHNISNQFNPLNYLILKEKVRKIPLFSWNIFINSKLDHFHLYLIKHFNLFVIFSNKTSRLSLES